MTRMDFMKQLGALLTELPDNERLEALRYYNEYFEDAGSENEAQVIRDLGSPEKIAEEIYGKERWETLQKQKAQKEQMNKEDEFVFRPGKYWEEEEEQPEKKKSGFGFKIGLLIALLLLSPIWVPILLTLLGAALGIVLAALGILIAVVVTGTVGIAAGVLVIGFGVIRVITIPAVGIVSIGIGAILIGAGILALLLMPLCWKFICWFVRTAVNLLRKVFKPHSAETE